MKALSIRSPWWEKILSGEKTIETRTWRTKHRGDLLICASQPHGMAVAVAELTKCRRMKVTDADGAHCPIYPGAFAWMLKNIRPIKQFPVKGQLGLFEVKYSGLFNKGGDVMLESFIPSNNRFEDALEAGRDEARDRAVNGGLEREKEAGRAIKILDKACEIMAETNQGADLDPFDRALAEAAVEDTTRFTRTEKLDDLHQRVNAGYSKPWLFGVESITVDQSGSVWWKETHVIESFSDLAFLATDQAEKYVRGLREACLKLEGAGEKITIENVTNLCPEA